MPENEISTNRFNAVIIDPQTDKFLAQVCLDGETFPTSEWVNACGNLQSFEILDEKKGFWDVWVHQRDVILRTEHGQRIVKITTYPAEGENQGLLNYISDVRKYHDQQTQPEPQPQPKRKLAFLQTLFGA